MSDVPVRLKRLTRLVQAAVLVGAVFCVLVPLRLWTNEATLHEAIGGLAGLPPERIFVTDRARLLGGLGAALQPALSLFGLWQLWRLFGMYGQGHFFAPAAQTCLRRFGWTMVGVPLLGILQQAYLSVVFSMGNPTGQKILTMSFSGDYVLAFLLGAVLLAIAMVLSEAARVAEENRLYV